MRSVLLTAVRWHRPLAVSALLMLAVGVVSAVGYAVDPRTLEGVPVWAKPLKFGISFAVYALTLAWLVSRLEQPRHRRLASRAGTLLAVAIVLETAAIVLQVVRGRQSHFNVATPFDRIGFAVMGVLVVLIFVASAVTAVLYLRESPLRERAAMRAVRAGLALSLAGMLVGFLMVRPRPGQGAGSGVIGAHGVGAPDGGPVLPLVGWNTAAGDLRVPHFVGLHALQVLPLLVLLLSAVPVTARLSSRTRADLVLVAAAGYAGLFLLTLWQALRGQALTAPDGWTLAAAAGLATAVVLAGSGVVRAAARAAAACPAPSAA